MRRLELPVEHGHVPEQPDRDALLRRGLRLEFLSLGWNVVEGVIAVTAGIVAGSVALTGFGVDSFIESASASVIVWRIVTERRGASAVKTAATERIAQKLVAASLAVLGVYVLFEGVQSLAAQEQSDPSVVGIGLAFASLGAMWWIARAIRNTGRQLHSHSIEADSRQTLACWWMSLFLIVGLGLNFLFGWWWADHLAALAIGGFVLYEGWNAWRGKDCCAI